MIIPTKADIVALHHTYAPSHTAFNLVYTHCQIIADIANQLLQAYPGTIDAAVVEAGALLHDIGTYRLVSSAGIFDEANYITHGLLGYAILKQEGVDEVFCRIAERHTGVGITAKEIIQRGLPLPPRDFIAQTPEEKLVMYADKFHSKVPQFNTSVGYEKKLLRFGREKLLLFRQLKKEFGMPSLEPLAEKYAMPIR